MSAIDQILRNKPSKAVHAIGPDETVYEAVRKMA